MTIRWTINTELISVFTNKALDIIFIKHHLDGVFHKDGQYSRLMLAADPKDSLGVCDPDDSLPYVEDLNALFLRTDPGEIIKLPFKQGIMKESIDISIDFCLLFCNLHQQIEF